jgi:hypothetical protein
MRTTIIDSVTQTTLLPITLGQRNFLVDLLKDMYALGKVEGVDAYKTSNQFDKDAEIRMRQLGRLMNDGD